MPVTNQTHGDICNVVNSGRVLWKKHALNV